MLPVFSMKIINPNYPFYITKKPRGAGGKTKTYYKKDNEPTAFPSCSLFSSLIPSLSLFVLLPLLLNPSLTLLLPLSFSISYTAFLPNPHQSLESFRSSRKLSRATKLLVRVLFACLNRNTDKGQITFWPRRRHEPQAEN